VTELVIRWTLEQVEDVVGSDKERMKVDRSGKVLQVLVGRCMVVEEYFDPAHKKTTMATFPRLKKEQVRRDRAPFCCLLQSLAAQVSDNRSLT
jgi:hypothetical protein